MDEKITELTQEAVSAIDQAETLEQLQAIRVKYLGKKGIITGLLRSLGQVAPEARPRLGQAVNSDAGDRRAAH